MRSTLKIVFVLCAAIAVSSVGMTEDLRTYTNQEFGFSFEYPASWVISIPATPNSRAKVVAPVSPHYAECAVIVQRYPQLASVSQQEIDKVFSVPPDPADIASSLSQGFNDVEIVAVSNSALGVRPAQSSRVRYNVGMGAGRNYISGHILSTATPGLTWTLTCGGQAHTREDAEESYRFWQMEINRLIFSFKFTQYSKGK